MADKKSTAITNADARASGSESFYERGNVQCSGGKAAIAAADADGQVYRIARLPSRVKILSIRIEHAAVTGGTDFDFGAYTINEGAVVDKDSLVDGADLSSARDALTEVLGLGITYDSEKRLWEMQSGVTTDPKVEYDICLTANTVGSATVTVNVEILWTW